MHPGSTGCMLGKLERAGRYGGLPVFVNGIAMTLESSRLCVESAVVGIEGQKEGTVGSLSPPPW